MQSVLSLKIKYRESFRPFAPSVLKERVSDHFQMNCDSAYMLLMAPVLEKRRLPFDLGRKSSGVSICSMCHARIFHPSRTSTISARIQTVHEETNPRYYKLL